MEYQIFQLFMIILQWIKIMLKCFVSNCLKKKLNISWTCSARVNDLSLKTLKLMKESGCNSIYVGIETGSQRMQKIINKNIDLDKALNKINLIKNLGIDVTVSLIYGFPDENFEDFKDTVTYIEKLYLKGIKNVQLHLFRVYCKTEEYEKVKDQLYLSEDPRLKSLFEDKFIDLDSKKLIELYPVLFSNFYTFNSNIRDRYAVFGTFIYILSVTSNIFIESIKYIIKEKGLLNMFYDLENYINKLHFNIKEFYSYNTDITNKIFINMMRTYLDHELDRSKFIWQHKIFNYEKNLQVSI